MRPIMTFPPEIGQHLVLVNNQMLWVDWLYRWYIRPGQDEMRIGYWARRAMLRALGRVPDAPKKKFEYTALGVKKDVGIDEHGRYREQYFKMSWPGKPRIVRP